MAGHVLHERDRALAHERDGHRMGAHALARDAAGGVGGVEEHERLMGNPEAGRRPLSVVLSIPGWLYLVGCVIGFFPMLYNMIASAIAGHWAEAAGGMAVRVFWPALFLSTGRGANCPAPSS